MSDENAWMVVERADVFPGRPGWMFVTGVLLGGPVGIGDRVLVRHGDQMTATTIRSIELHSRPGRTTIVLDADLRSVVAGTVLRLQDGH